MDASVEFEGSRIISRFQRLPNAVQTAVQRGSKRGLLILEDRVRTGTDIKNRGGGRGLMGRLTSFVSADSAGMDAVIGFRKTKGFPYELSQEFGAKAKPGKAMSIPLTPEARRVDSPREMDDLVLIKTASNAVLAKVDDGRVDPQFVLVKSIKPRLRFRENVQKGLPLFFREVVRENDKALEGLS